MSYQVQGPHTLHASRHCYYTLLDDECNTVADVFGDTQQEALNRALAMAAAEDMRDVIDRHKHFRNPAMTGALAEAVGTLCEVCETPGQPSRMIFGPTNRAYHPTCLPDSVKREIALDAAAEKDDE